MSLVSTWPDTLEGLSSLGRPVLEAPDLEDGPPTNRAVGVGRRLAAATLPTGLIAYSYLSRAAPGLTRFDLDTILASARRYNQESGITGRLIILEEAGQVVRFAQWIEGPPAQIAACVGRIMTDSRHVDIEVRHRAPVGRRRFSGWDMMCQAFDASAFVPRTTGPETWEPV